MPTAVTAGATTDLDILLGFDKPTDAQPKRIVFNYSLEAEKYKVVVLDTRTDRAINNETLDPPNLIDNLDEQLPQKPAASTQELLIVVSAAPVFGPVVIEQIGQPFAQLAIDNFHAHTIDEVPGSRRATKPTPGARPVAAAVANAAESCLAQDLLHGGGGQGDAEAVHLADDPLLTQRGFSRASRSTNSRISPPIGGRPFRPAYVQRRATRRRCQRDSVVGATRNDGQRERGDNRLAAARQTRSVVVSRARCVCRRSIASSCRRTTISSSLKSWERGRSKTSCSRQRTSRQQSEQNKNNSSESAGRAHESTTHPHGPEPEPS
jgi:hypothetical protein